MQEEHLSDTCRAEASSQIAPGPSSQHVKVLAEVMWRAAALITLAALAAAKEEDKKIDGPVIGIDLGTRPH